MTRFIASAVHPTAAWPTRVIAYPIGARLAYLLYKLGFTPNAVSIFGLLLSFATVAAVYYITNPLLAGFVLFIGLELSYIIDCSDGVLARATGQTSAFGALLDKLCDGIQTLVIPLLLIWIMNQRGMVADHSVVPMIIFWVLSSSLLTHTIWFKPIYQKKEVPSPMQSSESGIFARTAGILVDNPTTRLGIAIAWAMEGYTHFMASYAALMLFIFVGYLSKQYRVMR